MNRLIRRLGAFGLLALSFILAFAVIRWQPQVEHEIRSIGLFAIPLAIAVFALVASAPFSVTDALAVMNGAIFGPVKGTIIDTIGLVLAAMLGYWVNQRASHLLDLHEYLQKLPPWVKRFPVGSPAFLIAVRVIPGFGGTVATATAAAFKVPMWVHVWTMCAIAVPLCTLLTIFGDRLTVFIHRAEWRATHYCQTHRCPRIFRSHENHPQETPPP